MSGPRTILHADMDAFYAAIEQRDRPELRGRPVVVGGSGRRAVVATASYEARRSGVRSAMPGVIAQRLCPQAVFVTPRMAHYAAVSEQVMAVFAAFTPLVEPLSLDEAFLDVTGSRALFGDGVAIAHAIQDRIQTELGLTVSIGVASNKFVAKVASDLRKPRGLVVVAPGTEREFLAPLPVRCLWGAGKVTEAALQRLGLQTLGDLQCLGARELVRLCGASAGAHFAALARGEDARPVECSRPPQSISHEATFGTDLQERGACDRVLLGLAEQVGSRLRAQQLCGRVVHLKVRDPDFTTTTRQRRLAAATHDELTIHRAAMELLRLARPKMLPVRLLGVGVSELVAADAPRQGGLFAPALAKSEAVLAAIDRVRARFGAAAIGRAGSRGAP